MKALKKSLLVLIGLAILFTPASMASAHSVKEKVKFLEEVDHVDWYRVEGKNIIIGWRGLPDNFYGWNHRTAVKASLSSIYEVTVWSVRYRQKNWAPGRGGQICLTTAKFGRFGSSSCKK